jgi:hypothetical protein
MSVLFWIANIARTWRTVYPHKFLLDDEDEDLFKLTRSKEGKTMKNEKGFIEEVAVLLFVILFVALIFACFCVRFKASNEVVSGIAYNTKNDHLLSGKTTFSVRAGENTYVTTENASSYCLPPNSPYKELVNKAAQDKRIKIVVEAKKYFAIQAPWTCQDNVTVKVVK